MKHKIVLVRNVLSGLYEINKEVHLIFKLTWSNYIQLTLFYFYMMQVRKKM